VQNAAEDKASMTLWTSVKAVEPEEATGWAVPVQDAAEAKASMTLWTSVKAVEPEEATGWAVPAQDAAEAKASVTVSASIKAVEPEEAIGVAVNVAEDTVVTLLHGIKEDASEKNSYIGISFTNMQQDGITHLAAGYISRTPRLLLLLLSSILSFEHSSSRYAKSIKFKRALAENCLCAW